MTFDELKNLGWDPLRAALLPVGLAGAVAGLVAWWIWRVWEWRYGHTTLGVKLGDGVCASSHGRHFLLGTHPCMQGAGVKGYYKLGFRTIAPYPLN